MIQAGLVRNQGLGERVEKRRRDLGSAAEDTHGVEEAKRRRRRRRRRRRNGVCIIAFVPRR
jgi:hypothetical protein